MTLTHPKAFTGTQLRATLTPLAAALMLLAAQPTMAQSAADVMKELNALKARISQLESQLSATQAAAPSASAGGVDAAEFNRVRVKTEALEDNNEALGYKGLKINGWMDPTIISSQNRKSTSFNFLNKFDASQPNTGYSYDNSFFGMAMLDLQKEMDGGTKWRLTLAPQKSAASAYNIGSIVHEASVSVPLGDLQTRFIAGQIPDWSGYEYIPSTQNKLITHNILFDYTMPNYYTGAGFDIVSGKWNVKALIGNLNNNRFGTAANEKHPLVTYRVDYAKGEYQGFGFAGQHGKSGGNKTNMIEADGYFVRGDLSLFGQLSTGTSANSASNGGKASWQGASVLSAYKVTPKFELVARGDVIKNKKNGGGVFGNVTSLANCPDAGALYGVGCTDGTNGFGPGMIDDSANGNGWQPDQNGNGVTRTALSLGANYLLNANVTLKAELRLDRANGNVFLYQDGSYRKSNRTIGLSTVVSF